MAITISGENNNDKILASDGVIDQISGFSLVGVVTATSFTGDLTGDVTGNLLGNVTGNINNSTLLLQTGGTERLRITSTGNIGLGVASPQGGGGDLSLLGNKALRWSNSGGTQYGDIYADTSSNIVFRNGSSSTERLRITSGGQVNIGTGELSQTDRMLNVYGGRQRITYTGPGNSFELMNSASAGNSYGLLIQGGTNSSDYNSTFRNTSGATLFRIRGDGYVGINQTSPQRYLHITGNDGATGATLGNSDTLLVLDNDGSNGAIIEFLGNATNGQGHIMFTDTGGTNRGRITYNHGSDYFRFDTAGSERLRILSNGNISVGSNGAAAEKFQVNGGNIAIVGGAGYKIDTHPLLTTASFTDISGGSYAARLGSTGTSTIRSTQIYGGGNHIATFDGVNYRLGINETSPDDRIEIRTTAHGQGITIKSTGNTSNALTFDANRGTEGVIGVVYGRWNGTTVAQMNFISGTDGTDKNDGVITFGTESAASNGNVNATERLRIDANGDINLGNNPTNQYGYKLNIEDSSQILYAQTASSGGTELKLYLDHGNTVANFGTVTSTDLAFVTSNTEKLRIASDGSLTSNANNNGQIIHTFKNDNTTAGSSAQTVEHWFRFNRTGGGMNHPAAKIVAGKEREWIGGATNQDGYLAFYTTLNENGGAERLRITSTGKVSLGSAPMPTPPSWLHVKGNTYQTLRLENYDGGSNGPYIELYNNSASPADNDYTGIISFKNRNSANEEITYSQIRSQSTDVTDATEDGIMTFHTRGDGTFGERIRIESDGRVQIAGQNAIASTSLTHRLLVRSQNDSNAIAIAGRNGDHISEISFYQSDASTKLGELEAHLTDVRLISRTGEIFLCPSGTSPRVKIQAANFKEIIFSQQNDNTFAQRVYRTTVSGVTAQAYTKFATVSGTELSSHIKMTTHTTIGSVVCSQDWDIKVGHSHDFFVTSTSLAYTESKIKIVSNGNQNYDLYLRRSGGANQASGATYRVVIHPMSQESVTFNSTVTYDPSNSNYITHEHSSSQGARKITASGGVGGNFIMPGTITKGGGTFTIPHPLTSKRDTHKLSHSFIEGPQMDLIYRGKTTLVAGISTVNIDTNSNMTEGTFVLLNRDVQCFTTNETGWTNIKGSVTGNKITIIAQDNSCTDTISWMVVGERQDDTAKSLNMTDDDGNLIVEPAIEEDVDTSHLHELYPTL